MSRGSCCARFWRRTLLLLAVAALGRRCCAARQLAGGTRAAAAVAAAAAAVRRHEGRLQPEPLSTANCSELYIEQPVDQFNFNAGAPTWRERYFVCDAFLRAGPRRPGGQAAPPLLFYAGNEGGVSKAVNTTGLMWDLAAELGALLLFGEVGAARGRRGGGADTGANQCRCSLRPCR